MLVKKITREKYTRNVFPRFLQILYPKCNVYAFKTKIANDSYHKFDARYLLDENSIPPKYVLQKVSSPEQATLEEYPFLLDLLADLPVDGEDTTGITVGKSISEWELRVALDLVERSGGRDNLYWFHRKLDDPQLGARQPLTDTYDESKANKLSNLKDWMRTRIPETMIRNYSLPFQSYYYSHMGKYDDEKMVRYVSDWKNDMKQILFASADKSVQILERWYHDSDGLGLPGELVAEMLHHCLWASKKCRSFIGREALVHEILSRLNHVDSDSKCDITLAVIGRSGAGKTALMSVVAREINELLGQRSPQDRPVIVRFCGTSPRSSRGLSLLHSICSQIMLLFEPNKHEAVKQLPTDYEEAIKLFHELLGKYGVILIIDGLDQLKDDNQECSRLSFLDHVKAHRDTRIIVSALPDEKDPSTGEWKARYGCDNQLRRWNIPRIDVPSIGVSDNGDFDQSTCRVILEELLRRNNRRLTEAQWTYVMPLVSVEPSALYITLACRLLSTVSSSDSPIIAGGVRNIINQVFDLIESHFILSFARSALGLLTYAEAGLTSREIEDILSLDDNILEDLSKYFDLGKYRRRIPTNVWLSLRDELQGLIVDGDGGRVRWYHRQLQEAAEERYQSIRLSLEKLMSVYFGGLVDEKITDSRMISRQPLVLTAVPIWYPNAVVNQRRCVEAVAHMLKGGYIRYALEELCNLEGVCARARCGEGYSIIRSLEHLHTKYRSELSDAEIRRITNYLRWLRLEMTRIVQSPLQALLITAAELPESSNVFQDYVALRNDRWASNRGEFSVDAWVCGSLLGGLQELGAEVLKLDGHSASVIHVAWSPDDKLLASSAADKTVRVWDSITGELRLLIAGHTNHVNSVCWSPRGDKIATASTDDTVRVWDLTTGAQLLQLDGRCRVMDKDSQSQIERSSNGFFSVAWKPDGTCLATGCRGFDDGPNNGHDICIWDALSGDLLNLLCFHESILTTVSWSRDGHVLVSSSDDMIFRLWYPRTGQRVDVEGHEKGGVLSVAFNHAGNKLASASKDHTIRIWEYKYEYTEKSYHSSVKVLLLLRHGAPVTGVDWSPNDDRLVSSTWDGNVYIWDSTTGSRLHVLIGHKHYVRDVAWSHDGLKIASASYDKNVRIWDASMESSGVIRDGHLGCINQLCLNSDGTRLASCSDDKTIKIWDTRNLRLITTLVGHDDIVIYVKWSKDSTKVLSASNDGTIRLLDSMSGDIICHIADYSSFVTSPAWDTTNMTPQAPTTPNSEALWVEKKTGQIRFEKVTSLSVLRSIVHRLTDSSVVPDEGKVFRMSAAMASAVAVKPGKSIYSKNLDWSPDEAKIAYALDTYFISVWSVESGSALASLHGHVAPITCVIWSMDLAHIISSSYDGRVIVWDSHLYCKKYSLHPHDNIVSSLILSPKAPWVATASDDGSVSVWNFENRAFLCRLKSHSGVVSSISWNHSATMMASTSWDCTICLWNMRKGTLHRKLEGHSDLVTSSTWSSSNTSTEYLASSSWDETVRVWDAAKGSCVSILRGHYNAICSLQWDVKGSALYSAAGDGLLRVWDAKDNRTSLKEGLVAVTELESVEGGLVGSDESHSAGMRKDLNDLSNDEVCCMLLRLGVDELLSNCKRLQWTGADLYCCDKVAHLKAIGIESNRVARFLFNNLTRFKLSGVPQSLLIVDTHITQRIAEAARGN